MVANDSPERPAKSSPIAQHFSQLAKTYGDGAYYRRRRIAGLTAIARELEAADSILDLGCGVISSRVIVSIRRSREATHRWVDDFCRRAIRVPLEGYSPIWKLGEALFAGRFL